MLCEIEAMPTKSCSPVVELSFPPGTMRRYDLDFCLGHTHTQVVIARCDQRLRCRDKDRGIETEDQTLVSVIAFLPQKCYIIYIVSGSLLSQKHVRLGFPETKHLMTSYIAMMSCMNVETCH